MWPVQIWTFFLGGGGGGILTKLKGTIFKKVLTEAGFDLKE